jgi:peptide/nickel transport system permease protein
MESRIITLERSPQPYGFGGRTLRLAQVLQRTARRNPAGAASATVLIALTIVAVLAPLVAPYDPTDTAPLERLKPPSRQYLMGTDDVGRDVFSRIVYGARVSLYVGLLGPVIGVVIGSTLGILAGYTRGALDFMLSRLVDAALAIPALVLMLVLITLLESGINTVALTIGIAFSPVITRVVRSAVLPIGTETWVLAARAVGCSEGRILVRYVLPNVLAPIIVAGSISIGAAILAEAGISFLGYGIQPPSPSWGQMLSSGGRLRQEQAPWLAIFPGLAIGITVLSANLFGDAVRDVLDPRLRGR